MLLFTFGQTEEMIVTLNEKRTLSAGYYLFVFENVTTRAQVTKIFNFSEDESSYTDRFNQFPIVTSTLFSGQQTGHWTYKVYEQASSSNTDTTGLTEVENGILQLKPATDFSFTENSGATTFTQYAG
jgi:hypothetical protein